VQPPLNSPIKQPASPPEQIFEPYRLQLGHGSAAHAPRQAVGLGAADHAAATSRHRLSHAATIPDIRNQYLSCYKNKREAVYPAREATSQPARHPAGLLGRRGRARRNNLPSPEQTAVH
jgi:hypothetical protein